MLNVYAWSVCPHCHRTIEWLKEHRIPFNYLEIEEQPKDVIQKVIDVNGGDDWVFQLWNTTDNGVPGTGFMIQGSLNRTCASGDS